MGRHEQREQVFKLLFRVEFHSPEDMPEQLALFRENNEEVPSWQDADAIAARFEKIKDKIPELDKLLNENTEGWDTTRVGKVELAVLRLGAYELRYDDDIPDGVAINEAVEIAKKYGQESSGGFVNAILAKIMKSCVNIFLMYVFSCLTLITFCILLTGFHNLGKDRIDESA